MADDAREECNGQRRSAAQSGSRSQIGPACIGRERHDRPPPQGPVVDATGARSQCNREHRSAGMLHWSCAWRRGQWGPRRQHRLHGDIHAACLDGGRRILAVDSRFYSRSHTRTAYVGRAPTCQASCIGMRCDGAVPGSPNEKVADTSGQEIPVGPAVASSSPAP
jgi:hypothetical protein